MLEFSQYRKRYPYLDDSDVQGLGRFFNQGDVLALLNRLESRRKRSILALVLLILCVLLCWIGIAYFAWITFFQPFGLDVQEDWKFLLLLGFFWSIALWGIGCFLFNAALTLARIFPPFGAWIGLGEESLKETLLPQFVRGLGSQFRYASSPAGFSEFRRNAPDIQVDPDTLLLREGQSPDALEVPGNIAKIVDDIASQSLLIPLEYSRVYAEDSVQQYIQTPDIEGGKQGGILLESVEISTFSKNSERSSIDHSFLTRITLNNPRFSFGPEGIFVESRVRQISWALIFFGTLFASAGLFIANESIGEYRSIQMRQPTPTRTSFEFRFWQVEEVLAKGGRSSSGGSRSSGSKSSSSSSSRGFSSSSSSTSRTSSSSSTQSTPLGNLIGGIMASLMFFVPGVILFGVGLGYRSHDFTKKRRIGSSMFHEVTHDNPEFARQYRIYAKNPITAMRILSNDFTWRISDFAKSLSKRSVYHFFFQKNRIWVKYDLKLSHVDEFMEFSMFRNMEKNLASYVEFFLEIKAVTHFAKMWNIYRFDAGMMNAESIQDRLSEPAFSPV